MTLPLSQAIIVAILERKGGAADAASIIEASAGKLTLGGIYTHLNRLERRGIIESDYSVVVGVSGHRMPRRYVRLLAGRPDLNAEPAVA